MIRVKHLAVAAWILLSAMGIARGQNFFRIEDLRPGMKGTGKTVYEGTKPEEFQVEIIGVMRGLSAGADAVLARLSGGPLAQSGVFEGMSGSPVFIEGKLLGAVAFSFAFSKDAIAGITPIDQMIDAFEEGPLAPTQGQRIILKKSMLWSYGQPLLRSAGAGGRFLVAEDLQPQPLPESYGGRSLTPIATPLSLGGFSPATVRLFGPVFQNLGFSLLQGSGGVARQKTEIPRGGTEETGTPLEPGSNIVVPLIRGDLDASAGGTVTHIDGDKVYAFGHPLFNLGFSELPMHKGRALTVFPSLQSSFKITEALDAVGTLRQDRGSGIYGLLGQQARMIPLHVQMTTSRGIKRVLNYEIAHDRFLTPFLVNLALFETVVSSERGLGVSTVEVRGAIRIKGEEPVRIDNRFSSDSNSPAFAALSVALPINFLLASGFENLEFEDVSLEMKAVEDDRAALLNSLRISRSELSAGDTLNLTVVSERTNGETVEEEYPIRIPPDTAPGPLYLIVADGTTIMEMDAREQGDELIPRDLTQLIRFINNIRKNDRLYVRMFRRDAGAVVRGEGMPGLPPSILSIFNSERNTGSMRPIQTLPLMEYELPRLDYLATGSRILTLTIKP